MKTVLNALYFAFFLLGSMASVQTNQGPTNIPQINSTLYIGAVPGFYATIQSGITAACAVGAKRSVRIPAGYGGVDLISGVTGGCTNANLFDERATPMGCYTWSGSAYTSSSCGTGSGGGSPTGAAGGDLNGTYPNPGVGKINAGSVPASSHGIATDGAAKLINQTSGDIAFILGGVPVTSPNFTGNLATNVLADYTFNTGSGTTLFDVSGANACSGSPANGTFGTGSATAPTWVGQTNVHFSQATPTQGIALPSCVNSAKTFVLAYYSYPSSLVPGGTVFNQGTYAPFISSSLGTTGYNFIQFAPCVGGNALAQTAIYGAGGCITNAANFGAGFHIKILTLGIPATNLDRIYIDGIETPYIAQGATAGAQSSGNIFIGTSNVSPWVAGGGEWDAYRLRIYSSQLSGTDIQTITQIFRQDIQNRGVPVFPVPENNAFPSIYAIGDSQTFGQGVTTPFPSELVLTNQPNYAIANFGISALGLQQMTASDQWRIGPKCRTNLGVPSVALVLGGTNDASINTSLTAAQFGKAIFQNMAGEIQTLKNAGCVVYALTPMSRFGSDPFGNTYDADMAAEAAQIRELAVSAAGADGVADLFAIPVLGQTGAAPSGGNTWWQIGGLHTTQAGTDLEAAAVSAAMNYHNGSTSGNPSFVSAPTYPMVAGDRFVYLTPSANNVTTLPDCTGATDATYTIVNAQATFTVTLKTFSSAQTLNGINYSSSGLTLPQGSYSFTIGAFPPSTSGCFWTGH